MSSDIFYHTSMLLKIVNNRNYIISTNSYENYAYLSVNEISSNFSGINTKWFQGGYLMPVVGYFVKWLGSFLLKSVILVCFYFWRSSLSENLFAWINWFLLVYTVLKIIQITNPNSAHAQMVQSDRGIKIIPTPKWPSDFKLPNLKQCC